MNLLGIPLAALVAAAPSPYLFGPLSSRLSASDLAALAQAGGVAQSAPIAVFAYWSQVLPETWYADLFLPATQATQRLRRGPVVHLQCLPIAGRCDGWQTTGSVTEYLQTVVSDQESAAAPEAMRPLDRPIAVEGSLSDAEALSLIEYIRSDPPPRASPDGTISLGICPCYPILSMRRGQDGAVSVVLSADGGHGITGVFKRTEAGWELTRSIVWVA